MPDIITTFATQDMVGLLFILLLNLIIVAVVFMVGGKKKVPLNIFLFNILWGLGIIGTIGGINIIYAYVVMLVASGLFTNIYREQFMGSAAATRQQILITYSVFFICFIFLQETALLGSNVLSGSVPSLIPVDNCGGFGLFLCAYNTAQNMLSLFAFGSPIGIFNILLLAPYLIFIGVYVIEIIRGVG